jgi:SPP1 family predicted phage head-tail adaptor
LDFGNETKHAYLMPLKGQDPGSMDRRVTIQTRSVTYDAYNSPVETWNDTTTVWCNVEYPKTGSGEMYADNVLIASRVAVFTIRYYAALSASENRLKYETDIFDIERISEVGRRNFSQVTAKLKENDGR